MSQWLINLLIVLCTFTIMEGVTWLTHKYVMHGWLWSWHYDHHNKHEGDGVFERNDGFFILFAGLAMIFFALGTYVNQLSYLFFLGMGITLYGLAYFIVHDVLIHQRLKFFSRTNNFYFRALRKAHKIHHKHLNKEDGECFGMLFVPLKYFREALKSKRHVS